RAAPGAAPDRPRPPRRVRRRGAADVRGNRAAAALGGVEALASHRHLRGAGLIGHRVAAERALRGLRIFARGELDGVEAAAGQKKHQVLAHAGTECPQLAAKVVTLAQQLSLGIAATLTGTRELDRYQVQPRQLILEILDAIDRGEAHAEAPVPGPPALALLAQLRKRHDHRVTRGERLAEVVPVIDLQFTLPQDVAHTRAP